MQLLAVGARAVEANFWGCAALAAAQGISEAAVPALLKAGAAVDKADTHLGMTPLVQAACCNHEAMVRALLSAGADTSCGTLKGAQCSPWPTDSARRLWCRSCGGWGEASYGRRCYPLDAAALCQPERAHAVGAAATGLGGGH